MSVFDVLVAIGITSILGAFVYIGRKLQVLEDLNRTTSTIKLNVKVISDYLTSTTADFDHTELKSYSPLKLTAKGSSFIKKLGFDKVFRDHTEDFYDFIDSEAPTLKYDVEKAAIKSIAALYDMDYMDFLKVYFYNHPNRSLKNVAPTLGVYIRDKYLNAHPNITE